MPVCKCVGVALAVTAVGSSAVTTAVLWFLWRRGVETSRNGRKPEAVEELPKTADDPKQSSEIYESEGSGRQYMEFHYTPTSKSYAQSLVAITESFDFPKRMAEMFARFPPETKNADMRALDVGCATGASVLEMSKYFKSVIGIDYSETFIHLALEVMRSCGGVKRPCVAYTAPDQGDITVRRCVQVREGVFPDRCHFYCGDAMHLMGSNDNEDSAASRPSCHYDDVTWYHVADGERFDAVLAANLLCRVPNPRKLLDTLPKLLYSGGILVLASPYSWWEGATPRDKWIGGRAGGPRSEEAVKEILMENFELLSETDEAFLIRDHVRRYQLGFSHCTVWRRR